MTTTTDQNYDRLKEVKQFDDSKIGVKGLVDSGLTSIPRFFVHSSETLPVPKPKTRPAPVIPLVDLSGHRSTVIDEIRRASSTLGFFQIINHGVPLSVLDRTIGAIKAFNEQPTEIKAADYHREMGRGAAFSTNFDLLQSKAASWRDTLQIRLDRSTTIGGYGHVPVICREAVGDWNREIGRLAEDLMGLLSEGLGLEKDRLKEMSCLDSRLMASHYYPYCPQPDLTVGIASHSDPGVLTVLLQNEIGGLQLKYGEDEDDWVDVEPTPGAIVINIGDLLQIISNEEYKSVEHRVLANPFREPRVSVAIFFNPGLRDNLYGPLPELVSSRKPAVYSQFTLTEFLKRFFNKGLDGKSLTEYFKI